MVRVFHVVRPVATVRVRVKPYPQLALEFGPVANTILVEPFMCLHELECPLLEVIQHADQH
jgi:hypothetical protein